MEYAARMQSQRSSPNGKVKIAKIFLLLSYNCLWYRIVIPVFMNGVVKSITCSLSLVMTKSATARSAFCDSNSPISPDHCCFFSSYCPYCPSGTNLKVNLNFAIFESDFTRSTLYPS